MSETEGNVQVDGLKSIKKSFNKKKWREQKYSCTSKVKKWEDIKRKQAERECKKEFKKLNLNFKPKASNKNLNGNKSLSCLKQAELRYKQIKNFKEERREEQERIKKERIQAIKAYKERKAEKFKKLSQKTRKGQPLMRGRIELLLEEIQKKFVNQDS